MKERGGLSRIQCETVCGGGVESRHTVAWPLASVLLPRDGGCECVFELCGWCGPFVVSVRQDSPSPIDV